MKCRMNWENGSVVYTRSVIVRSVLLLQHGRKSNAKQKEASHTTTCTAHSHLCKWEQRGRGGQTCPLRSMPFLLFEIFIGIYLTTFCVKITMTLKEAVITLHKFFFNSSTVIAGPHPPHRLSGWSSSMHPYSLAAACVLYNTEDTRKWLRDVWGDRMDTRSLWLKVKQHPNSHLRENSGRGLWGLCTNDIDSSVDLQVSV